MGGNYFETGEPLKDGVEQDQIVSRSRVGIENGELIVLSSGGEESAAGGDIVTEELYGDFELKFDFRLTEGQQNSEYELGSEDYRHLVFIKQVC